MKISYTTDEVITAINYFSNNKNAGLCSSFSKASNNSWKNVPTFLRALGGRPKYDWFWFEPINYCWDKEQVKKGRIARNQRKTMLAFMWVWSQDKDFEV
jgi:hypothetical protein